MEPKEMGETCRTTPWLLNWNLVYLEKKGYLELDRSPDCSQFVACSASITAEGIDLVENESIFNSLFPESAET